MKPAALLFVLMGLLAGASASAEEAWRTEFDRLCGKSEESMSLRPEELRELVARCEKLRPAIEASASPQKNVYLKRLEACRKVFVFVIEGAEKGEAKR
jgi:hypothetical protein